MSSAQAFLEAGQRQTVPAFLAELKIELEALTEAELAPRLRLEVLETLRPALWRVLAAFEAQQLARALPFAEAEQQRWQTYIEAWTLLLAAYLRSLADADDPAAGLADQLPLLLQRVLRQATQVAVASYRAYQPLAPALWQLLHEQLQRAESAAVLDVEVADPTLTPGVRASVIQAYLHLLLVDFMDPYALSPGQLVLAVRWMEGLAALARLSPAPVAHGPVGFLVVNLERGEGMRMLPEAPDPAFPQSGTLRFVDLGEAREQLKRQLSRLRLGTPPEVLGLIGDCTREEAELLLERLYRRWRTTRRRSHPRRETDEAVRIALGLTLVHRLLLAETLDPEDPALGQARLVDQSASGLGLIQAAGAVQRIRAHQAIALLMTKELLVGAVRWMVVDPAVGLRFGVDLLGTRPRAARIETSASDPTALEPALWLPALPALDQAESLLVPPGIFFAGREVHLHLPQTTLRRVRLQSLLATGSDFERATFRDAP